MSSALRKIIMQQLSHATGKMSDIIYTSIQYDMEYNQIKDWFEIELEKLKTEYFKNHSKERGGIVEGTNIYWKISSGKFIVYLK